MRFFFILGDIVIDGESFEFKKLFFMKNGLDDNNWKSFERSYLKEYREFFVRIRFDENVCVIMGILFLLILDWVFCDKGNSKLKFFDR